MKKKARNFAKKITLSLMSLLMVSGCSQQASDSYISNKQDEVSLNKLDFNQVLDKLTIGFENDFNDSVLTTSTVSNKVQANQQVTVIIELAGSTTMDSYLSSSKYDSIASFNESKEGIAQTNELVTAQAKLAAELLSEGLISEVNGNYSVLMNGFYATTTYGKVDQIRSYQNVEEAYVSTVYNEPDVVHNYTNIDAATGIYQNDTDYDGSGTIVAVLDSGFDYTHEVFNMDVARPAKTKDFISSVLNNTVAYELNNENLSIDDVYLSSKVPFAYDYADKKADVYPIESDHGTHVSGIIGGDSDAITGIATQTQFAFMKVFSDDDGGGDTADIVCALEDSVLLGVDAINLSLGALGGYSEEVIPENETNSIEERVNKIYQKIEQDGVSLVIAAGNDYSSAYQSANGTNLTSNPESGTIGSPGSYSASLTVGSINGTLDPYALINGSTTDAVFFTNSFDSKQTEHKFVEELFTVIDNSADLTPDAQGNINIEYVSVPGYGLRVNYSGLDMKNKIAVVRRGNISFEEKMRYAAAAGAIAILIYNNVSGSISMTCGEVVTIPTASISIDAGAILTKQRTGTLTFNKNATAGPFMSDFSSWGPLADLTLKPEITAHGGNIYSSVLGGGYDTMSGTSMATPNTCGIVVIIRQYVKEHWPSLNPTEVTNMVNQLLMSTATICLNEVGNPYSVRKQGAGLASLMNSVETNAYLYVEELTKTKLELGDDKEKTGLYECEFNIRNISNEEMTYDVSNLTMTETVSSDEKTIAETAHMLAPTMNVSVGDALSLSGTVVTVPAYADSTIKVTLQLSTDDMAYLDRSFANGMYVEGFITLDCLSTNATKSIDLSIPFLAFYGDWLDAPIFDKTYYEVEADRVNNAIDEDDKVKADQYATTPYGRYGEFYILPLGGYVYAMDSTYDDIAGSEDKAAISIDSDNAIYELYSIYVGLLRGAKKMTMSITNAATGQEVYSLVTYNNRKATYYAANGGTIPYNEDYSFEMFNQETGELFANNTKLTVTMKAELDYENGAEVGNNTFSFSFYVDYETPTLENVEYIKEWDKTLRAYKYYLDLTVSDNRYVQSIRPCTVTNGTLLPLTTNPIPVYQTAANQQSIVRVEITDYFDELYASSYANTIFFMIDDYAMNSNIFFVALNGADNPDIEFNQQRIEMSQNSIIDLNDYLNIENAMINNFVWSSSNPNVATVSDAKVYGVSSGIVTITGRSLDFDNSIRVQVFVNGTTGNVSQSLTGINFTGYTSVKVFDDDYENSGIVSEGSFSYIPASRSFTIYPSESFKLDYNVSPWYYDDSKVEVIWSSSNSAYVSVSEDGTVTALRETVSPINITATVVDNGVETVFTSSISVNVNSPFIHSGIMLQYYKGFGGDIVIPDDLGIQYIGEYAFSHYIYNGLDDDGYAIRQAIGDNTITSITVPDGVKYIQESAFENLTALKTVSLPETCTDIYVSAFEGCSSLESINLNNVVKVENYAFKNCSSLTNVNSDDVETGKDISNIVTIGIQAFYNSGLNKVDLNRARLIGSEAFANSTNLTDVTLYELTPVSNAAFASTGIVNITIPSNVVSERAFADCDDLQTVTFTNTNINIGRSAFAYDTSLATINFASNTSTLNIGSLALQATSLSTFNLPSCNVYINDEAFIDSSLVTLHLSENTTLDLYGTPFVNNDNFANITVDSNNDGYVVVDNVLYTADMSTIVLLPSKNGSDTFTFASTVTTIGESAFAGNIDLGSISIPSTITNVNDFAFAESLINSLDLTNATNVSFGDYAFYGCEQLITVNGLDTLTTIPTYAFTNTALEKIEIGDNVTIEYGAFAHIDTLNDVTIGDNANIGAYAFYSSFASNNNVVLGSGVIGEFAFSESNVLNIAASKIEEIGRGAFTRATALTSITLSDVTSIAQAAFSNITTLKTVTLGDKLSIIPANGFVNDTALETVNIGSATLIGDNAFANCTNLSTIDLSNVTYIGQSAFFANSSLTSISLASVETLHVLAFSGCSSLTEVSALGENLTTIAAGAFNECTSLASIDLSHVTTIDMYAFNETALTNINLNNVIVVGDSAFYGSSLGSLSLPNCKEVGEYAFFGTHIITISIPSLEVAGRCAFAETHASTLDLPVSLKSIDYGAFASITGFENFTHNGQVNYTQYDENNNPIWTIIDGVLYSYLVNGTLQLEAYPISSQRTSYTVAENTSRIEAYAFYQNSYLTEVYLPYSLTNIGDSAFYDTESLRNYYFASFNAPTLEGVFNDNLRNYLSQLSQDNLTDVLDTLYQINQGTIYNMFYVDSPYFYSNFDQYVGLVDDLVIHYPSNGVGYDNWIYTHYFTTKIKDKAVAEDSTNNAINSLLTIVDITTATLDNEDFILDVYNDYIVITDPEQKALLDESQVAHLLDLYNQITELHTPTVSPEEVATISGLYTGDSEGMSFSLNITSSGSGTLKVDTTEYSFDKVRKNSSSEYVIVSGDRTFTFTINEDKLSLNYYVMEVELSNSGDATEDPDPELPPEPTDDNKNGLWIALGCGGAVLIAGIAALVVMLLKKRKKATKSA